MPDFVLLIVSAVVGAVLAPLMQLLKKASAWLDGQSSLVKRVVVVVLAGLAALLTHALGVPVPEDILGVDSTGLQAILSAAFAMLYHTVFKKTPVAPVDEDPKP